MAKKMTVRKVALITGAGIGIGRGIAIEMARDGYDVAVHYNSSEKTALSACKEIEELGTGVRAVAIKADISKYDGVMGLFADFKKEFNRLDVFVNNSGVSSYGRISEMKEADFDLICNVNWKGAYFCIQQAGNYMAELGIEGSIVAISSNNEELYSLGNSAYATMKVALRQFCKYASLEYGQHGIRVNSIAPGWTSTPRTEQYDKEGTYDSIPMRRWAEPSEVGQLVLYLASDYSKSITGASIMMDGGAHMMAAAKIKNLRKGDK